MTRWRWRLLVHRLFDEEHTTRARIAGHQMLRPLKHEVPAEVAEANEIRRTRLLIGREICNITSHNAGLQCNLHTRRRCAFARGGLRFARQPRVTLESIGSWLSASSVGARSMDARSMANGSSRLISMAISASLRRLSGTRQSRCPSLRKRVRSGVADTGLFRGCWYRRIIEVPALGDDVLLLHFGGCGLPCHCVGERLPNRRRTRAVTHRSPAT